MNAACRQPMGLLVAALAVWACGSSPGPSATDAGSVLDATSGRDTGPPRPPPDAGPPPPEGAIEGQVVDVQGLALAGVAALCCTPSECIVGETDANGSYRFAQLSIEPRKILLTDPAEELMDGLVYQAVVADQTATLSRPAVMHARGADPIPWTGGRIVLGAGTLELTAAEDSLDYGRGITAQITAQRIALDDLPPVAPEPWRETMSGAFAYLIAPVGIRASQPVHLRVLSNHGSAPGATFALWAVDGKLATASRAGTATVTNDNVLTLSDEAELVDLGILILVPER